MTQYVTDGGLETDLIFHFDADLPEFAAFPLVEDEDGRALLTRYYDGFAAIAAQAGVGLLLEAPTWRANPDWAAKVGYDLAALDRVNRASVELMQGLRQKYERELGLTDVKVGGMTGPRGDGYVAGEDADPDEAAEYHAHQARSQAAAGADLMTALTFTGAGEAIGFVRAVRDAGVPAAVGFTVETDGRLPDGTTLRDAVARVDALAAPDYYVVNCATPPTSCRGWRARTGRSACG
jgi:homocysteine S-methyltransferase